MAFSVATILDQPSIKIWTVTAAIGDSGQFTWAHGFKDVQGNDVAPDLVFVLPLQTGAYHVGQWVDDVATATLMRVRKEATGAGSSGDVRVIAMRPHSLIRG